MIARIEKFETFEANLESRKISDLTIFLSIVVDYSLSFDEFDITGLFIYMFKPFHYFQLSHLSENLLSNIILDWLLSRIFNYYQASVFIISQKMTLELNLTKSILYVLFSYLLIKKMQEMVQF